MTIGDATFIVRCSDAPLLIEPTPPYEPFIADSAVHSAGSFTIDVDLHIGEFPSVEQMTEVFRGKGSWSMFRAGVEYYLALNPSFADGPGCIARFRRPLEAVTVYCGKTDVVEMEGRTMVRNPFTYPLDQLLLMYALAERGGFLVHAAGVELSGAGYIFPGRSGAGKSTLARQLIHAGQGEVLSDDRVVVRKVGDNFHVFGTPWPGEAGVAVNKGVPLTGIMFLSHGGHNRAAKLSGAEAVARLLPVVSVPWYDREVTEKILRFCDGLITDVPAHELSFKPDKDIAGFLAGFVQA
jgi:hypothetical protein